jgi:hypothetical protein
MNNETLEEISNQCSHFDECHNGNRYGKGCYEDDFNNAMGGKPWQECHCGINEDGEVE